MKRALLAAVVIAIAPLLARAQEDLEDDGCDGARECASACERGDAESCFDAGSYFYSGDDAVDPDWKRAREMFEKACDGGIADGCSQAGRLWLEKKIGTDDARAAALFGKACDAHDDSGCAELGSLTRDGRGVSKDESKAAALFEKSCNESEHSGCAGLALFYEKGTAGKERDLARAADLYRKGCNDGDDDACAAATRLAPRKKK